MVPLVSLTKVFAMLNISANYEVYFMKKLSLY